MILGLIESTYNIVPSERTCSVDIPGSDLKLGCGSESRSFDVVYSNIIAKGVLWSSEAINAHLSGCVKPANY